MAPNRSPLIVYFGHHKCATQWMKGLLRGIARRTGLTVQPYTRPAHFNHDLNSIAHQDSTLVCFMNARLEYATRASNLRGWHMVRDPRDIVVSSYFSHRYSHPTGAYPGLENLRSTLHSVSRDEGLMIELQRRGQQFRQMECWDYGQKNVLEVRMEDVTSDPVRWLHEIMDFVGLYGKHGIGSKMLGDVAAENDFRVYTGGRSPGEEEVGSHYRRGVPGDWRVHLGPEHVDYFKRHYNPLLLKLGYEQSPDWT